MRKESIVLILLLGISAFSHAQPELVYPGDDGKLVYVKHANSAEDSAINVIPDFSNCGYMGGGVALPDVPVKAIVYPEIGDDRQRIQDAINKVSELPPDENGFRGAVLLKAGQYDINEGLGVGGDALRIRTSGVVLRGEGQGANGTVLRTALEAKHQIIATRPDGRVYNQSNLTRIADDYVGGGAMRFSVEDISGYSIGDTIAVTFTPNNTWLAAIKVNEYLDEGGGDLLWTTGTYNVIFERFITDIVGDTISIHSPVILPMQKNYGGGEVVRLSGISRKRPQKIGIENMRLVGPGISNSAPADGSNRLQTGIHFEGSENCWARGVTVVHTSNSAVRTWSSNYITVEDIASLEPLGPKRGGYRYTFYIDGNSSHVLMQRTYTEDGRHDWVLGQRTPGPNVFLDGYSIIGGTQGPHQRWAVGTLFDNLSSQSLFALEHRGSSGSGHGWAGVQSVIWNTESPDIVCDAPAGFQNYAIGNTGTERLSSYVNNSYEGVYRGYYGSHGSHVIPRSLYLQQLEDRLGESALKNVTIEEQRTEDNIYDKLEAWAGESMLNDTTNYQLDSPDDFQSLDFSPADQDAYVTLTWTDVAGEAGYVLERSSDGGNTFSVLAQLEANTTSYEDQDLNEDIYYYRLKAINGDDVSAYINLLVNLEYQFPMASITFRVDLRRVIDLQENGDVYVAFDNWDNHLIMSDDEGDKIYQVTADFKVGSVVKYAFAYQNGEDSTSIRTEIPTSTCSDDNSLRIVTVTEDQLTLDAVLFSSCNEGLPDGTDITDLDSVMISGSNEEDPWIDGDNGSGSPENEGVDKLIDNNVDTKYLVRAVESWVDIEITEPYIINAYTITSANDVPSRDPRNWKLFGYDEVEADWVTLHEVQDNSSWDKRNKPKSWYFENNLAFTKYRLHITAINNDPQKLMQMAELQLFGEKHQPVLKTSPTLLTTEVYPNPTSGQLVIAVPGVESFEYKVYAINGELVAERAINSSSTHIDLNQKQGIFLIHIHTSKGSFIKRIIVK